MKIKKKYTKEQIKEKFQNYKVHKDLQLEDDEYDIFCTAISFLDKNRVDEIHKQIFFSYSPRPSYFINFSSKDLSEKKGLIYFKPLLFDPDTFGYRKEEQYYFILHEIGHHILGHEDFKNSEEEKEAEVKAAEFAIKLLENEGYSCESIIKMLENAGYSWPHKNR